jgi:hypothetical protein
MFTGFASENTPAIQVWDFFLPIASGSAPRSVSLADDCAPVQLFRTGSSLIAPLVYLPSTPIEGKRITIINACYSTTSAQPVSIRSSDTSGLGTEAELYRLGQGQTLELIYIKNSISFGQNNGLYASGWVPLNFSGTTSPNYYAVALGGLRLHATGIYSSVLGGSLNTASGDNSSVLGGTSNTINGSNSVIIGGTSNVANGQLSAIAGGTSNVTTANNSAVVGGNSNYATAVNSFVGGGRGGSVRSIVGNTIFPASDIPISTTLGCTQTALLVLGRETTNATATVLTSNTSAGATTNQVILPNNSAYFFRGEVIAGVTAAGNTKGWTVEGVIKRGANAASTALVGTATVTSLYADAGAATWSIAVTADTTNGGLKVEVTGQAATTIRWVAQIRTTEMTY